MMDHFSDYDTIQNPGTNNKKWYWYVGSLLGLLFVCILTISILNTPGSRLSSEETFSIPEGSSITAIAEKLEAEGLIRSALLFKILIRGGHRDAVIASGTYQFSERFTTTEIVDSLVRGDTRVALASVTFPEGFSVHDLSTYVADVFGDVDATAFVTREGYLFPETYFIAEHETIDDLIVRMEAEYEKRIAPYRERIDSSGLTENEVIIFASILEREANDVDSMRRVAGVLHNRLRDDLSLQVDATFEYLLGKSSAELTIEDLAMDSPFNTYTNIGLPPAPIANPGIMAIEAVLDPIVGDDYFYLTGTDGTFHYAQTFEEHKANKLRYLQ